MCYPPPKMTSQPLITKKKKEIYIAQKSPPLIGTQFLQSKRTNKGEHSDDTRNDERRLVDGGEQTRGSRVTLGTRDSSAGTRLGIACGGGTSPLGAGAVETGSFTSTLLEVLMEAISVSWLFKVQLGKTEERRGKRSLPGGPQMAWQGGGCPQQASWHPW